MTSASPMLPAARLMVARTAALEMPEIAARIAKNRHFPPPSSRPKSIRIRTSPTTADRAAEEALRTREPVDLEPMSSVERKIVHLYLQDRPGIETASEGADPNRYVIVRSVGGAAPGGARGGVVGVPE